MAAQHETGVNSVAIVATELGGSCTVLCAVQSHVGAARYRAAQSLSATGYDSALAPATAFVYGGGNLTMRFVPVVSHLLV